MALIKEIPNQYGTNTNYWKIVDININWLNKSSHVALCGWIDKQARLDGKQPTDQRSFDWSGADFPFDIEILDEEDINGVRLAYEKIKSLTVISPETNPEETSVVIPGEFADAEDNY